MIEARATFDGDRMLADLKAAHVRAVARVTVTLWTEIQQVLNVPNTGVRVKRAHGKGSYTVYPNPSKPGEPPRKRTGWLQRNVVYEFYDGGLRSRVGLTANAEYGIPLDQGSRTMAARPWLFVTAERMAPQLAAIAQREVARG